MALVMFGTKPGGFKRQCSGLPAPWYLSLTLVPSLFVPQEAHMPQREQMKLGRCPLSLSSGAEHGEGTRWVRGGASGYPPLFTAISMSSSLLPPTQRAVVWIESKFTNRHPWGEQAVDRGGHWGARQACTDTISLYIMYRQTEPFPSLTLTFPDPPFQIQTPFPPG